jgi:large subunit ribosomal protein L9
VGDTQALFGSVTTSDIAAGLLAKGFEIDRRKLQLREPIKKLGEYAVPLKLHLDVTTTVKVKVVAEGAAQSK